MVLVENKYNGFRKGAVIDKNQNTVFHHAVLNNNLVMLTALLDGIKDADLRNTFYSFRNNEGLSAIQLAEMQEKWDLLTLLALRADPRKIPFQHLDAVSDELKKEVFLFLVDKPSYRVGVDQTWMLDLYHQVPDLFNESYRASILLDVVINHGDQLANRADVISRLVQAGALDQEASIHFNSRTNICHYAILTQDVGLLKKILNSKYHHGYLYSRDENARTPLELAIDRKDWPMVNLISCCQFTDDRMLAEGRAPHHPVKLIGSAARLAAENNDAVGFTLLVRLGGLDKLALEGCKDEKGNTACHSLMRHGNLDILKEIIAQPTCGEFLMSKNQEGDTPLDLALKLERWDLLQFIMDADVIEPSDALTAIKMHLMEVVKEDKPRDRHGFFPAASESELEQKKTINKPPPLPSAKNQ